MNESTKTNDVKNINKITLFSDLNSLPVEKNWKDCLSTQELANENYTLIPYKFTRNERKLKDNTTQISTNLNLDLHYGAITIDINDRKRVNEKVFRLLQMNLLVPFTQNEIVSTCRVRFLKGRSEKMLGDDKVYLMMEVILHSKMNPIYVLVDGLTKKMLEMTASYSPDQLRKLRTQPLRDFKVFRHESSKEIDEIINDDSF